MAKDNNDFQEDPTKSGNCFIATAAYGTSMCEELNMLRRFRDETLLNTLYGKAFVATYYKVGPKVARLISRHELLRTAVRGCFIAPIISLLRLIRGS